jgi:4-amino-4-deoxy-L-arabinose transferase-like glycosyltransferase
MSRTSLVLAAGLALLGILLPVGPVAAWLAGGDAAHLEVVRTGVWCFKAVLLLHAILLVVIPRLGITRVRSSALSPITAEPARRTPQWEWAAMAAIVLVGALLRFYQLPNGLWFDEIQTLVEYVRDPMGQILTTYDSQNQHLFYSVLARISFDVFGESAVALRLPAAVLGIASLWAAYLFGRLVASRTEAVLAAAFLAFSYHHVWFSQNARGYTGLLLWTLLGSACFLRLLTGRYQRPWGLAVLYGLCMALAAYTHITAVLIAVAHFIIWLVLYLRARPPRGLDSWIPAFGILFAATLTLQLYALVLPQVFGTVLHPPRGAAATEWQSPIWFFTEALRGLSQGVPGGWFTLVAGMVVVGAGLVSFWRRSRAVVALMLLPAAVSGAALLALEHNLWPRFFFFSAGFAVLIVIRGGYALVEWLLPRKLRLMAPVATVLVIAASALTVPRAWYPKQDFTRASEFLAQAARPGDTVVTVDLTRFPYQDYYRADYRPVDSLAELEAIEAADRQTWVLYTFPIRLAVVQPQIWARLQERYTAAARFPGTIGGGAIVVMKSRDP